MTSCIDSGSFAVTTRACTMYDFSAVYPHYVELDVRTPVVVLEWEPPYFYVVLTSTGIFRILSMDLEKT